MARRRSLNSKPAVEVDPATRELAWRAVRNFQKMTPILTGFARSFTGDPKLIVRSGKSTLTDGKTIYIRPPLQLGEKLIHERSVCDVRDETTRMHVCLACRRSDDIWHKLHHEMSHILGETLVDAGPTLRAAMYDLVDEWHPADVCEHAPKGKKQIDVLSNVFHVARTFKFLGMITEALEDVRVDAKMLALKPGLTHQFYANIYDVFENGFATDENPVTRWTNAPLNAQIIIGLYLVGRGFELQDGWLRPEAMAVLEDEQLRSMIAPETHAPWPTIQEAAITAIDVFRRLNEIGACKVDKCVKVEAEEPPPSLNNPGDEGEESDSTDPSEAESGDDEPGNESGSDDPDASSDDGSGDDDADPTGDGTPGETADAGAFGDDFENPDDSSDGEDHEGKSAEGESDEEPLPDGGDDDDADQGSGDEPDHDDLESDADGRSAEPEADGADGSESDADPGDDESEATDSDAGAAPSSSESSGEDGADDAPRGDGDSDGSAEPEASEDLGGGSGPEDGEGDGDPGSEGTADDEDGFEEEAAEEDAEKTGSETLGEDVWDEENPASRAVRSVPEDELGDAESIEELLHQWSGHEDPLDDEDAAEAVKLSTDDDTDYQDEEILVSRNKSLDDAISQSGWFDRASVEVAGVKEYTFPEPLFGWRQGPYDKPQDFTPSEQILGPALLQARKVFAENARSKFERHLRSGRVDGRVLGRRAALGDDRIFKHRSLPGKRDYVVGITVDCSGSTSDFDRMERIKRAVFAKAELLSRLGIKFYITGHTGGKESFWTIGYAAAMSDSTMESLMILWIKKLDEPWNDETRNRLAALRPLANNFDGHTLEFHRKILESRQETDKILIYYTDGAMPAANYDEELIVLADELQICDKKGIVRLAVGINTESPARYGFDTVRVDSDDDLIKVVELLERHLIG